MILALRELLQRLRQQRQPTFSAQNALVSQLDQIVQRCANRPILGPRVDDDILGFDNSGLPS